MLLRFRVSNYRSLRDEQELSMVASSLADLPGAVVPIADLNLGVLPVAAIYGANAAGKSNVLGALRFMREAVIGSHRAWKPEGPVPLDPFLLDAEHREGTSLFEVDFLIGGVRHRYGFEVDRKRVTKEWLSVYPRQREQVWFARNASDPEPFKFGKSLKGNNRAIEALTRANSLFLSAAAENNHQGILPIYSWFTTNLKSIHSQDRQRLKAEIASRLRDDTLQSSTLEFLQLADLGIIGIQVRKDPVDEKTLQLLQSAATIYEQELDVSKFEWNISTLEFQHRDKAGGTFLPFEQESNGTQVWLTLVGQLLRTLDAGSILCIDELDASLHPHLALEIIRIFQDPVRNPKHAQLIFNTHDTTLLGNLLGGPHLRRDQIWFVEKDGEGATHLYPLTDFKPRNDENLERGYLQGRFGAIPFIEPVPLVNGE